MDFQHYSVTPMILRTDSEVQITVHPKHEHAKKQLDRVDHACFYPILSPLMDREHTWVHHSDPIPFTRQANGDLVFSVHTFEEDEYVLLLEQRTDGDHFRAVIEFRLYALGNDLFELRPYRGDFHMHSTGSDGGQSPEYVAAVCRKLGCDFMALTDHGTMKPSLEVIHRMNGFGTDMLCIPGEEVHLTDNPVHVVNFGGRESVNDLVLNGKEKERFEREVAERMKQFPAGSEPLMVEQVSKTEWEFDRIREAGGIAIFAHPYWCPGHNYVGGNVVEELMTRNNFDAVEVFGGFYEYQIESNMLSLARYEEERAKGKTVHAVGVSDCHSWTGDEFLAKWYYTIVFAKELSFESIAEAIRDNRSVAVHQTPGSHPIAAGPFRLVRIVYFLLREFFPLHNDLCRIEGEAILRAVGGEDTEDEVRSFLRSRKGTVPALWNDLWAK